jgi:large subunit ribosomal protein L24
MRIHKGDTVIIIAGKDRNKTGKVIRAFPSLDKVIVEGVNIHKRHVKPNKNTKQGVGIVDVASPVHVSNVQLLDPKTNKRTRVGVVFDEVKKKNVRVAKKSGTTLK